MRRRQAAGSSLWSARHSTSWGWKGERIGWVFEVEDSGDKQVTVAGKTFGPVART